MSSTQSINCFVNLEKRFVIARGLGRKLRVSFNSSSVICSYSHLRGSLQYDFCEDYPLLVKAQQCLSSTIALENK